MNRERSDEMKVPTLPAAALLAALAIPSSTACSSIFGQDCTLIHCTDGLNVEVNGVVAAHYTVEVRAGEELREFSCQQGQPCTAFFQDWRPAQVTVAVSYDDTLLTTQATPDYLLLRPNGRRCPPECLQGRVLVEL
jgi:hypothetical protein